MTVAFVQDVAHANTSGGTLVMTVGVTTTAGHMLSVQGAAPSGIYITSVADSKGNTYQVDVHGTSPARTASLASCIIAAGKALVSSDTVTITWSASASPGWGTVTEYSGVEATAGGLPSVDRTVSGHSATTTVTAETAVAADTAGELVISCVGANVNGSNTVTAADPDSGGTWTDLAYPAQPNQQDGAWQAGPGTLTKFNITWTNSGASNMDAVIACYRPANTLTVTTTAFPQGQVATAYQTTQVMASGGTPPYTFSVSAGHLPGGLTLTGSAGGTGGGQFGATIFPTGTNPAAAYATWNTAVGRTATALKVYPATTGGAGGGGTWSDGTGNLTWFPQSPSDVMQMCINAGMTCFICYKPSYNPHTTADFNALQASLTALKAAGLKIAVILGQEIENQPLSPAQYFAMLNFYKPAVTAALGSGFLYHDASGSYRGQWKNYFPAPPNTGSLLVDHAVIDMYSTAYANGTRLDPYVALCTAAGIPFGGVIEMGVSIANQTPPAPSVTLAYLDHIRTQAVAYPGGHYMWYQAVGGNLHNVIPGYASGQNGGPNCVPKLQALADTVTAGGTATPYQVGGTPAAGGTFTFTLQVTDSVSATATQAETIIILDPQPPPPPPPPVPQPVPVAVPAAKPWRFLLTNPQPDGAILGEITQAQTRSLTVRSGAASTGVYSEASVDILGTDPNALLTFGQDLAIDLQVWLGGQVLFCGRMGATSDTLDAAQHRFAPTFLDYREVLRRRSFADGGGPGFQGGVDVADIAWGLIRPTVGPDGFHTGVQGYEGGDLGISRGAGKNGLGISTSINYTHQQFAGIEIDNLAAMNSTSSTTSTGSGSALGPGNGFDWDITPYAQSDLRLDMWTPIRGTNRGVVLEYGGGLISSIQRTLDPSTYANDVFATGAALNASTTVESGSNGGTIANIASWSSPSNGVLVGANTNSFAPNGQLTVHASGNTNAIINYTGINGENFTGCTYVSGSPSGTVATGNSITQNAPANVQLDMPGIGSAPQGRWSQVVSTPNTSETGLANAAAWFLLDGQVILPSYQVTFYPGTWGGPGQIWIGDTVTIRIDSGRLQVNDTLPVTEMDFTVDANGIETLTLTAGRIPFRERHAIPRMLRRLRALETQ